MRLLLLFSIIVFFQNTNAQSDFGIDLANPNREQVCQKFNQVFSQKLNEVKFSIKRNKSVLFFETNDKSWFDKLFNEPRDGVAIDVVSKDFYDCDIPEIASSQIKGVLLKPVYSSELKSGLKQGEGGVYRTIVGRIPTHLMNKPLEFNILFLSDQSLCMYYVIYDLESYPWDLLDMGMYLDSLTYNPKAIKQTLDDKYIIKNKSLKFNIPFKKNKSEYSQKDIKPIYDSLRLTDFNIKAIKIKVYSSIEGSLSRNLELQKLRTNSIISALQSFQKPTITTTVSSSENWVDFLNDIQGSKYDYLKSLSKKEIKQKIVGALSKELEPILKNHRLAILELELERKDKYKDMSSEELLVMFNSEIAANNIERASEIQNSIFEKIKNKEISLEFLRRMEIPKQSKFVKIFNKNSAYRFMIDVRESLIVYKELLELEKLAPNNAEVRYNIIAVKIKLWRYKAIEIDWDKLKAEIQALKNYKIDKSLISRMLVNYHIIRSENLMQNRDYANKDKSVAFINGNYKNFQLSNYDYLSLAQFLSYYGSTEMSVKLLENKVKRIDTDEDLLFYYLNLTIIDNDLTESIDYRTIMLNALNMNKERYCQLFNAFGTGGVTFQLLENEYLRRTYCENCTN